MIPILGHAINYKDYTTAEVTVHVVGWFGDPGHVNMNYVSSDQSVCDADVQLMASRGIKGINFDYYGPESPSAITALRLLNSCERFGLEFSICIDEGAIPATYTTAAQINNEYIRILNFLKDAFFTSPAYLKNGTAFVVSLFNFSPLINMTTIRAGVSQPLSIILQGSQGFTLPWADGGFCWPNPIIGQPDNLNLPAINTFVMAALAAPSKFAWYTSFPGFDDSMAGWGAKPVPRLISRRLGQTTLDTLNLVPKDAMRVLLATWDDFEEGTATRYDQG